ncbi:PREDICTED: LYR [Prunus dulcis]|uniref:PREDICTED: LYR n=1 Tax=Prunus dulcis TaxID=3755 RepID=A0A5E4FQH6_PRUDU|nr:PREDICTED: LYR [Prunus dulcis]
MSIAAGAPSRAEVLTLFRSFLRVARKFTDYNIREYTKRRTIDAFRQNRNLMDPSAISAAFSDGKAQFEVANRQAVVYSLYAPKLKSVMEVRGLFTYLDARFQGTL